MPVFDIQKLVLLQRVQNMNTMNTADMTETASRFYTELRYAGLEERIIEDILSDAQLVQQTVAVLTTIVTSNKSIDSIKTEIADTDLTVSLKHTLLRNGITTVGSLALWTEQDLRAASNIGDKTIVILKALLRNHDLVLRRYEEKILDKAQQIYKVMSDMPAAVLIDNISVNHQTAYRLRLRYGSMTIGEIVAIGASEFEESLRLTNGDDTGRTTKATMRSTQAFLGQYDLTLK